MKNKLILIVKFMILETCKFMVKINRIVLCILLVALFLSGCSSASRVEVMKEVKTTDLSNENIDDIKLSMHFKDKSFVDRYGQFEAHPDNKQYTRNYDQYWNEDIIMSVERETGEILQVTTLQDNVHSSTDKGIRSGTTIKNVISTYGENYYKDEDQEQSIYVIGYVDQKKNLDLAFTHLNGKVISISLSYAFDRLKWEK
ncbi:hypothetical protein [Bacillus sp. OAE603]|uniref:hypothetical protein n=1 Tax=Gottfriedia sp. OAE603 TaxID=2663872 RepID=UPI00178A59F0